jgi:hypothetical protein
MKNALGDVRRRLLPKGRKKNGEWEMKNVKEPFDASKEPLEAFKELFDAFKGL